jgi:hypothetical protein
MEIWPRVSTAAADRAVLCGTHDVLPVRLPGAEGVVADHRAVGHPDLHVLRLRPALLVEVHVEAPEDRDRARAERYRRADLFQLRRRLEDLCARIQIDRRAAMYNDAPSRPRTHGA